MRVLLTRPRPDSARIAAELAQRGMDSVIWPMMAVQALVDRIDVPPRTDALAFTSANAVQIFADMSDTRAVPALCVGARTAEMAKAAGFADVHSAEGVLEDLAALIVAGGWRQVFHPHGRHVAGDLAGAVAPSGATVAGAEIYETRAAPPPDQALVDALLSEKIHVVTLWSFRSAALFAQALRDLPALDLTGSVALAISENAAKPLVSGAFARIDVAPRPSARGMIAALDGLAAALRQ
ncbi:MAG: uroporphyrinogen-III synthase [Pseudomonadota bacterium]